MKRVLIRVGPSALLLSGLWHSGYAAAGRPMTIDDLMTAVRVTEPALSPDGRRSCS